MTTVEQPLTRADLREELRDLREEFARHYATKSDLAELETRLLIRLAGIMAIIGGLVVGVLRFWQ